MAAPVKKTREYLIVAAAVFAVSLIAILIGGISLAGMNVPYNAPSDEEENVVVRTSELIGNTDLNRIALYRVGSGFYTAGDYAINAFTSSDYLIRGKDDPAFASDLSLIINGSADPDRINEALAMLAGSSRMYVINEMLASESRSLKASSSIPDTPGDSFTNCELSSSLEGEGGVTLGIRKVQGSFVTTGEGIRTDFFVDGICYQGNIVISDAGDGVKNFVMSWNSNGVGSGSHEVLILLRSSDGRGTVLTGGEIFVPDTMTLVNNNVQPGSIGESHQASWYVLNAGDSNAYINFVNLSGDIKVSIYDAYGTLVGYNDIPGTDCEILRGVRQDVMTISEDTGLSGITNTFYIKVERGALNQDHTGAVTYTMIQSREAAYYDGSYVAVIDDDSNSPDVSVIDITESSNYDRVIDVQDMNNNVMTVDYEDLRFIPLNGVLENLDLTYTGTGLDVGYVPSYDGRLMDYGFMSADQISDVTLNASAREGNFATITAVLETPARTEQINLGGSFSLDQGENTITLSVRSFDGITNQYSIHILIGDDAGTFCEDTLSLFPVSYGSGLWLLHSMHPDYIFTPVNTGLDFYTVLDYEDSGSRSLANIYSNPSWADSSSPEYDGGGWHAATNETVRFFLDPRNYLDQVHIFSFETLSFNEAIQTVDGVRTMVSGSFMDSTDPDYAQMIYNAGQTAGVSPYLLSSRIIQEMGYDGQSLLCSGTLPGYEGYYNFYNIGSVPDPSIENGALINGARYAMWGSHPEDETIDEDEAALMLPWDNPQDAITGGAIWIAQSYIGVDQDTLYFQKFDVISNNDGLYNHQYAQNISMAYTEGQRYFRSYASSGMLDEAFEFQIPVYTSIPDTYGQMP